MKKNKILKSEMVKALISDDIEAIKNGSCDWMVNAMENGFKGYNKMSLKELTKLYNELIDILNEAATD